MAKRSVLERINSTSLLALVLILVNSIYLFEAIKTAEPIKNGEVGITFFPIVASILLYIAAIIIFIAGIKEKSVLSFQLSRIGKPIMVIFLTLIYVLIFKSIGYFISSIIYVLCLMFLFEEESGFKKKKLLNILFTVIIVALIYILYQKIFGVRLPIGEVF
ncbi:MAG: hypothetical protein XD76_1551 [candidate division TA06 bacterium 32_111]|jgi:putative tricarboxylic transport membrane protein|nr:MAG: hypothetical protein XD76_1551 [candidate division TA06 bacterium 32_111]